MKLSRFLTGGAMATLAAALAVTSVPAAAQDNNRPGWRTSPSDARGSARAERPARTERAAPQRAERPSQPQRAERGDRGAQQQQQQRNVRDRNDNRRNETATRGGWNAGNAPVLRPQQRNPSYVDPNRNVSRDRDRDRRDDRNWRDNRRDNDRNWRNNRRDNDRNWRDDRRGSNQRWDHRWRDNNRYNWYSYRSQNRNLYRVGRYYAPYRNYNYRRLTIGLRLDSLFYTNRYWINDPWRYRLPDVYGSYRWVRYYNDALLVDMYSGEVVDVIYDFFW